MKKGKKILAEWREKDQKDGLNYMNNGKNMGWMTWKKWHEKWLPDWLEKRSINMGWMTWKKVTCQSTVMLHMYVHMCYHKYVYAHMYVGRKNALLLL
jgi:hypothetical protein